MICRDIPTEAVSGIKAEGNGAQHHRETGSPVRKVEVVSRGTGTA
jgi:hypothetical protein